MKKNLFESIIDLFAPDKCAKCNRIGSVICNDCARRLACQPIILPRPDINFEREIYLKEDRSGRFLRQILNGAKAGARRSDARALGRILAQSLMMDQEFSQNIDKIKIVAVPTSDKHIRQRGFCHTSVMASQIEALTGVETSKIISRSGNLTQIGSDRAARIANAQKSYFAQNPADGDPIYLIIDDLRTTGATIRSIAGVLRKAGARRIWAAYLIRHDKF